MLMGDLMAGRPDLAIVDTSLQGDLGPPRPELEPPVAKLRQRAADELSAAWAEPARPSRIAVFHREQTAARYRVVRVQYSIDEREAIDIPVGQWATEDLIVSLAAPVGVHVLALESTYESPSGAAAAYRFTVRSAHPFTTTADRTTNLIVTTRDRSGTAPEAAGLAGRIAVSCLAVPGPVGP
jgi:hypothetical protein